MKVNDIVTITVKVPPLHDDPFWAWNNATQGEGFAWNASYLNACRSACDLLADQRQVKLYMDHLTKDNLS